MVSSGSLAMIFWKLGQARKGAAVPKDLCAEMWLGLATQSPFLNISIRYRHFLDAFLNT